MEKIQARHSIIYWLPASLLLLSAFLSNEMQTRTTSPTLNLHSNERLRCISFSKAAWLPFKFTKSSTIRHVLQSLMFTDLLTDFMSRRFFVFQTERRQLSWDLPRSMKISLLRTLKVFNAVFLLLWDLNTNDKKEFFFHFFFFSLWTIC